MDHFDRSLLPLALPHPACQPSSGLSLPYHRNLSVLAVSCSTPHRHILRLLVYVRSPCDLPLQVLLLWRTVAAVVHSQQECLSGTCLLLPLPLEDSAGSTTKEAALAADDVRSSSDDVDARLDRSPRLGGAGHTSESAAGDEAPGILHEECGHRRKASM